MNEIERRRLAALPGEISEEATLAERNWRDAIGHAIKAGEKLIEAKGLVKHGDWLPWLEANFPGAETTAQNYMRLARNPQRVADLPTVRDAVALLAASKPEEAKTEAEAFETVTTIENVSAAKLVETEGNIKRLVRDVCWEILDEDQRVALRSRCQRDGLRMPRGAAS